MEIESVPIIRYSIRFLKADMGLYIQISPLTDLQFIQIRMYNRLGYQVSLNDEKKIENIFFRGDYPRKDALETGKLIYPTHHLESYIQNTTNYINPDILTEKKWNIIVDCFNGTASHVFPDLLDRFGCSTTVLRGQVKEFISDEDSKSETIKALKNIVKMAKMNSEIGVIISPHGTEITIVDEMGNILTSDDISAILCIYYIKHKEARTINLPVTTSMILEDIIKTSGGEVVRTSSKMRSPENISDIFDMNTTERFPYLEQISDPMITFLRVLKFLSIEDKALYEIKESLPKSNIQNTYIHCTTDEKAAVMRMITTDIKKDKIELIDGIKINETNGWVLILPDATQPIIHIYAEGDTVKNRDKLIDKYIVKIKKYKSQLADRAE
jgi:mannose-1-phosphate guanylyltransferase/phosphomannomutase